MPTIQNSSRGQVVQIWGKAYIRGTDGVWRPLSIGETVPPGAEILTEQNAIVMMTRHETPLPKIAESPVERAIAAVENNEAPPAAGLLGGGSGDLQPGLRVDRIVELVTPAAIATGLDATTVEFGRATQSDPGASAIEAPRLIAASSSITSVEAGGSVNLGLRTPSGPGPLTITVTTLPTIGEVFTAAGAPVVAGTVLTADELAGLIYRPPVDYTAGTPVGTFGYSVSNGIDSANGGTRIAVTPVNDAPLAIDGSHSGAEDILLDVSLTGTDIDGTVTSIAVRTAPANGTLLLRDTLAPVAVGASLTPAQAATLVFRPNPNWNGSTSFTFTVTDNEGAVSAPATVQLQITPVNDPPLAVNDSSSTVAQVPVTVAVLGNDSDADNDPLTVTTATVSAALGSVVINGDGTLTFTAAPGVTGAVAISYTISDPSGATSTATLTVNVAAAPTVTVDAPALTNDSTPTLVGTSNLPPGSTVTLTVTGANGAVQTFTTTVRADGTYSVDVPAPLAEGPYTAVANVNGPGGTSATASDIGEIDITPPVITVDAPALTNDSTPPLTGTTDLPPGSTITLTVTGANGVSQLFSTTVQAGGVFSIDVPAALISGPFTVIASGTDAAGNTATATDNGVVDAVPPVITVDAPALTNDTTPALTGTTDLPAGSTVTLTVTGANGAVQTFTTIVQAGGVYSVDVPAALVEGNFNVVATGTDAAGNTATASDNGLIDITAPTVTVDAPALTNDTTPPLTGTTNLPAGSTVTLTVTGANGAVQTFSATVQAGGTFSVDVPAALVQGNFSVTATATDAAGNSASASDTGLIDTTPPAATLTIDPVTADNIVNAGEATGNITITGTVGGDVRVGDTVTLNIDGVNYSGLVLAGNTFAIAVPGTGVLADADRRIDGSVTTTDNAGNSTTATAQRPYSVNSAPIAVNDALSVGEDAASGTGDVTPGTAAQDRDADGDTLTVIGVATGVQASASGNVNTPIIGTWGTLLLDGLGAYTYAPSAAAQALDPGQTVTDTFTYTIEDGRGGSATATLTISVVGANDPTTISGVFIGAVTEDAVATASGTLTNNDPDVGTRAFVAQSNSAGAYGTFSIDAAGDWNYTLTNAAANVQALAQGQSVTETFIVATDDGTTASITVTVSGANDAPVVSSTSINAVEEGAAVALGLTVPSDIDNGSVLTITVSGLPTIGQVQLANGTAVANGAVLTAAQLAGLRYLPPAEYDGVAPVGTFAYSVSDGITAVNGGTTITVATVNDPPQAFNDARTTGENSTLSASVPAGSDADGTISSYALVGNVGANNGALSFNNDGSYSFATGSDFDSLAAGQSRQVTFTYTATDNGGAVSTPATVTITVSGANDAPTGADATYTIAEDGNRAFAGADFGFSDIDVGDTLAAVRIDSLPAAGTLTLNGTPVTAAQVIAATDLANLVFTPLANASGAPYAAFTFSVQDNGGLFDSAPNTITFNVTPDNDPPLAVVTPASGDEDTPIAVSLTGTDIDGTIASVRVTVLPANGTLFLADGITPVAVNAALTPAQAASLIFAPAANFNGTVNVTFTVTDNSGATSAPAVTPITVAPVIDPAISIDDVSVNEAAGTITFTVTLDQPTTATVSVNYATANGSAASGADYTAIGGTVSFAPGVTTQTVTIDITDDTVFEGNETFNVLLSGAVNATIADGSGLATITDNDTPTIAVSSPTIGEGGFAVFTVSLSNPSTTAVTFNPALASGTATAGTDTGSALQYFNGTAWVAVPVGGVTLAVGTTSVQVRVATIDDFAAEGNETFSLTATVTAGTTINPSATGTAIITDDSDVTTLTLSATPSVAEGGSIVYTATLDHAAVTPMTVMLSSGQTISIAAGFTAGSISILAPGEDPYIDAGIVTRSIASTAGGGFESLTFDGSAVSTTVTDTIDTTTVSITGDATVAEGATAAYTVSLTSPAQTAVTVNLAYSGVAADGSDFTGVATVTILAGTSSAALNIATLQDLLAEGAESFTVTIASAAGGNFENLVISGSNGAAITSITDDDTPALSVSSPTVGEGGFAVFTVSLSNASTTAVTFNPTLSSSTASVGTDTGTSLEYFNGTAWVAVPVGGVTLAAGATSVQVRVATTDDFAAEADETFNLTATVTAGTTANASATGTATITDDIDATTVSLSATPSVAEGGSIIYTATLNHAAVTAMTVTLSSGQTIGIAAGATFGSVSIPAPGDDPYIDAGSVSRTIASTSGGGLEAVTINTAAAVTTVADTIDITSATLTATPSVAEGGTITWTVSLGAVVTGSDVTITLAGGQTITIPVGLSSGFATGTAPDNAYAGGNSVSNRIASASGGNFEQLTPNTAPVSTTVTDDGDVTTVSLTATPSVVEGGSITYTATLTFATQTPVSVTLSNGAVITIAAGAMFGTANVLAPGDDPYIDASTVSATIATATGGNFESLQINPAAASTDVTDNADPTSVSLSATASVAEGGSIIYTATLTNAAQTPVTVTLSSGETIAIAAGTTTGSVTILAPTDDVHIDAGSVARSITTASGGNFESLTVNATPATTTVTDTIDTTTVSITGDAAVAEGATASYTVSLTSAAQTVVTVNLSYSGVAADGTDFTGVATVVIAAGSSSANFSIATLQDALAEGAESFTVTLASAAGGNFENLVISGANGAATTSITDDDTPTISVSSPTVTEGGFAVFTVSLSNASTTAVVFTPSLASGSATVGTDTATALEYFNGAAWVAVPVGGISIAAGSTNVQVRVATTDDVAAEGNETFALTATVSSSNTGNANASGTATITDDIDATTVTLSATPSVAEGGSIIYTATLTSAALAPMTVTLSNGAVISIAAGATFGSTPVAAPGEDVYVDAGSVSATIATTSGGGFEAVMINSSAAVTTVNDTIDTTSATLSATPSVAEGGTITYTVSLGAPVTGSAVTVTLANGQTVTIAVGAVSGSVDTAVADNVFAGGGSLSNNITSVSGGNFEQLTPNTAPVTTAITDDGDVTIVTLSATPSVVEGGDIVYTATLTNAAQTPVTITLSNGATIGIAAGATIGTVTVSAPGDDPYIDAATVSATIATATGGNFESLQINPAAAATGITDDVDPTTVSLTATANVAEGGSIIYTATLTNAAQTAVTVTLSSGQTITIAAGTFSGMVSILAPTDDVYVDAGAVSRTISSASGGNFESLLVNPAAAATNISDTIDTTTATLTATPSVVEGGTITWTVSLGAPVTGSDVTVTLTGGQTVTIPVGFSSGFATGTAPDNLYAGGTSVSNRIASASGGNFEQLTPNTAPVTTAVTDDADATTVTLTATTSVVEGGNITYTAALSSAALSPVTVTLSNGATITIAAGAISGFVLVPAPSDDPYIDASNISTTISSAAGGGFEQLDVNPAPAVTSVTDDVDATTVSLSATASIAEGGSILYTATLTNAAQTPVTVTLSTGQTITIAAGNLDGSVSILAPTDDVYLDGSTVSRSISSANGGNFEALNVNTTPAATTVTDTIDTTTVSITGAATVAEGATAAYTVSLTSAAQTAVTVNLSYSGVAADGSDFTGVATVTIPAGFSSASFNIATLQDVLAEGVENFTVTIASAAGGNFESLVISGANGAQTTAIIDDDTPALSVSSPTVGEGGFAVFTVSLSNTSTTAVTFNPTLASDSATVGVDTGTSLEYFNGTSWVAVPVGGVTLAAGSTSVQIRVATIDDFAAEGNENFTLTATVTAGTTANASATGTATITDDADVTTVSLSATPSVAEGGNILYTATLDHAAVTAMTVTLSSGQVISIAAGALTGTLLIGAPADDPYIDAGSVSASIVSTGGGGFEAVTINSAVATTTVSDTIDTTTATLTATPSVAEGGQITYTVSLGALVTVSAVNVLLANGQTVVIPVGAASASVTATAPDNMYSGGASVTTNIVSASGGNFEQLTPNTTPVSTAVTDDGDVTTVTLTATPSVVEGTNITYTATLTNTAQTAVTVTLSNGATINIAAGTLSGTVLVAAPGDDPYIDASTVSATIATATGGNFENLQINPAAAGTNVTDDADPTTVTITASAATVTEGGSIIYTASVNNAVTGSPLVVTLSNGQTITIPVGQSSATSAAFLVRADDAYVQGTQTLNVGIAGTAGGNFEALTTTSSATTTVTDDADATTVTITASAATVTEGGSITYTASVNNAVTGSALVVTLSNGQTISIPVGQSSASSAAFLVRADDAYVQGTQTLNVSIAGTAGGTFEALTTTSTATTTVTDDADATTVTITASAATVSEGGSITYTASVNNAVTGSALVVTLSNGQTITIPVGQSNASSAAFAVRADDAYVQGTQTLNVGIAGTAGGNFEALTTTSTASTTVTDDADATIVTISTATTTVTEGGSIVYTASVNNVGTGSPLVVTLSNGQTITIPVGQSSASSTPFAVRTDDADVQGTQTLNVTITATTGGNYEAVTRTGTATTTVTDDADATTVTITASAATVTEGGSITYTASVNNAVTGSALVVTLSNGQTITIPVGQSSASSAAFAVRADDAYAQGTQTLNVGVSSTSGANFEALTTTSIASTTVTDDADMTTVTITASAATVSEGGSITYTASVNNVVTGSPLVVTLSNGQTITIPVGQSNASSTAFSVRADDAYLQGTQTLNVGISSTSGANFEALTTTSTASTTVTDDADATTVTISTATTTVTEGGSIVYTASVSNVVTGSPLVVMLSNGQTITIPVGQSSASSAAFVVRADDAYVQGTQTVNVTINTTSGGNYEAVTRLGTATTTVTDDADATTVTITASAATVGEGGSITYTASVNNAVTGSPLVVTLSNGQTITIPVGQSNASSAAFAVRADDAYAQGTQTLNVGISSTSGANFEALTTTSTASTTVIDDADPTTVTITASAATVTEGGSIVYTASVSNAVTGSPLVVTLSNGQTITIPIGQSSASSTAFAVRTDDAYVQGTQTINVGISSTSGANFEALTTTSTASTTVTDDADASIVTITASAATVGEGGSITYTASVNNAVAGSPLVVTLSNGQVITIPVGQSSASGAAFAVRADDAYVQGTQTLNVGISSTSGATFEALTTTSTASTAVTDDADATIVTISTATTTVTEGGSIVYTASVNNVVTGSPLVVTLSNGQAITISVGQSSASSAAFVVRADDAYVQGTQTLNVSITTTSGGNYEAVTRTGTATTTVTDDADATTVTITASAATVTEGGSITYTASVNNVVTGSPLVVTLSNGQTITIPVGQSNASSTAFSVRADDAYLQGTQTLNVGISSTSGANFEALTTTSTASTTVTDDADATTVTISTATPTVTEGGSIVYTASVSNVVTSSPLVLTLSNGQTITIPVGQSSASSAAFAVRADDAYAQGTQTLNVTITTTSGGNYEAVTRTGTATTTVTDDADATTVTITASAATVTEGGSIVYTASVNNAVTGTPLVVTLSNGQTITIPVGQSSASSAAFAVRTDDAYVQGTQTLNVGIAGTTGGNFEALTTASTASTTVTDDADATAVSITAATASVIEGGSIGYTVSLTSVAQTAVTVNFTYTGTAANGSDYTGVASVTIAAGASNASFTIVTANDAATESTESLTIAIASASGGNFETLSLGGSVTTSIVDNDTPPEGRNATVAATEDTPFVFGLANFLMNDAEQGNNVNPSSVRIDALPNNGSLFLNGVLVTATQVISAADITSGLLRFVPASNANGNNYANFNFSVRDASGLFDPAPNTITVNVAAVNDGAPDARNDLFMTTVGTPIVLTAAQLLANDTLPDGATITGIGAASGGTLVNNGNGTYTWTPSGPGAGTFTYTLTDQDGQTDTATVRIVATAAADDLATVNESALANGTGAGTVTATGNLFTNDSGNTAINSITFNGTTVADGGGNDTDARAGYIGIGSTLGRLVVDTAGAGAGDYTYTLLDNANNSAVADDTSVTEVFTYDANSIDAALRVAVTDDAPLAISRTVQVSEDQVPSYRLVLVLDVSGSMDTATAGGEVQQLNADGSITITTRLAMARQALAQLVNEYYNQAQNVSITLITFSDGATVVNPGAPYTTKDAAVNAILAADGTGGTNYTSALTAVQSAYGTVNPAVRNAVYFVSDGAPSGGDLVNPATSTGYANFVNNNNIDSFAVGVGTGIATTGPLNGIHNVDANGNGTSDGAIIVPDLNDLGAALLSTVPLAYGGNVVSSSADGNVLGADGGYIQTVTVRLDTNGDGTRDTDVTFTRNTGTNQISSSGAYPPGFPITGDLLTLGASRGFNLGTLTFNFSTGDYTYFTGGTAAEGDSFSFAFVARDGDGDVTPASVLTIEIADGHPVARPDSDTLLANQTHLEGNVISGLGTDAGLALGGQLTNFAPSGAGVDDAIDGAQVSSVTFKGVTYALGSAASGTGTGFSWTVAGGQLTWTATAGGERLVMNTTGYYDYSPPTAALPTVNTAAAVTTLFNSAANADDNGVVLGAISRTGATQTLTYRDNAGAASDGVGVTGGGSDSRVDNLETLVVSFSQATHPQGVQGVSFVVSPDASDLGDNGLGTITSLTYTVFDVAGNQLGQFYSTAENTVTIPPQYSNIGRIEIEANSAAEARITSVSFSSVNVNTTAAEVAPVEVSYTLTDTDGDTSSSTLTLRTMSNNLFGDAANNTITGTNANDRVDGGAGNDTLGGGAGNDLLIGGAGVDALNGGDGTDELRGGSGNDILVGGNGNDILVGGMGNDALTGGAGADVFRWELADRGVAGTPSIDTIADFNTAQGDRLDLRDLLQGETLDGSAIGNLSNYLFVERTGSNTTVHISSNGGFTSGYNAGAEDQTIVLTGIDLTSTGTLTSQQVIQDLLNNNRLAVDP